MTDLDVFIIGGGTAGSEVAFGLARAGVARIGLAERDRLGGECTWDGCVPTKALIRAAAIAADARAAHGFGITIPEVRVDLPAVKRRVRSVVRSHDQGSAPFERAGIELFPCSARIIGPHEVELDGAQVLRVERIVLATGTRAIVPPVPGLSDGPVWTNTEAIWDATEVPERLAILGAGAIGVEFAQIYARFGSDVTLIEAGDAILPSEDAEIAATLAPGLEHDGIRIRTGTTVERADHGPGGWTLETDAGTLHADQVLVATGREPVLDGHDLDAAGVKVDEGKLVLDEHLKTSADAIWAAGDATGELLFTHVANHEARIVVDSLTGGGRAVDYRVVPRVTWSAPEVASVGLTEVEARERDDDLRIGRASIAENERAQIDGQTLGTVKVIADADGQILGGHIVAAEAGAMIHEIVALMAARVPAGVAADAIHAYPSMSESVQQALSNLR